MNIQHPTRKDNMTQENRTIESIIQEAERLCREYIPFAVTVWATELPPNTLGRGGEIYGVPVIVLSPIFHLLGGRGHYGYRPARDRPCTCVLCRLQGRARQSLATHRETNRGNAEPAVHSASETPPRRQHTRNGRPPTPTPKCSAQGRDRHAEPVTKEEIAVKCQGTCRQDRGNPPSQQDHGGGINRRDHNPLTTASDGFFDVELFGAESTILR